MCRGFVSVRGSGCRTGDRRQARAGACFGGAEARGRRGGVAVWRLWRKGLVCTCIR